MYRNKVGMEEKQEYNYLHHSIALHNTKVISVMNVICSVGQWLGLIGTRTSLLVLTDSYKYIKQ